MVTSSSTSRAGKAAAKPPAKSTRSISTPAKATTSNKGVTKSAATGAGKSAPVRISNPATAKPAGARPALAKKPGPPKKPASTSAPAPRGKPAPTPAQRFRMTQEAAYYLAEKHGFAGNAADYWIAAEAQIDAMLAAR